MACYRGEEYKFTINIEAQGFDMNTDDFDIEVKSGNTSVKGYKDATKSQDTTVVIFKETATLPPETEGDEPTTVNTWYAIVDTSSLAVGQMRAISTAYIVDANANDGIRKSIDVKPLDKLIDP